MSLKITVIEDAAMMRMMLEDFLKEKYPLAELTYYATGEEAIENILAAPDLVLLDYNLNSANEDGINGIQVLKKLKERFPKVAVIFLSGQEKSEVAANTMKHGALDYIIKNENIFQRLEIALNNILGQTKVQTNNAKQRVSIKVLLILAASLLVAIFLWRSMK